MTCNGLAKGGQAERRGVGGPAVAQRAHTRFDHRGGRGEVGLADLHVDHGPALRFERVRAREHVHDLERLDLRRAPCRGHLHGTGDYNFSVDEQLKQSALEYHRRSPPGKLSILPTKQLSNQRDLALAYTPGVAAACEEIVEDPVNAYRYTARGNLVGVITNGTAVLGLGNIGALASKPVMEGKAVLFKKFAGIDVFDIEINETDPDKLIAIIKSLEPTFGGVNLEDIKAPECFKIETELREKMNIPIMHDDQHGTAIISAAALLNALEIVGKKMENIKIVVNGAGAAAVSCTKLYMALGATKENIIMCDSKGVLNTSRTGLDDIKKQFVTAVT